MIIYVKDNVERVAGDAETAKRLVAKGYIPVNAGSGLITPDAATVPKQEPPKSATATVQTRRRSQRGKSANATE